MGRRFELSLVIALAFVALWAALPAAAGALISTGDGGWLWQNPLPQGNSLFDVTCLDAAHAWAVGEAGTILGTTDGGATWQAQRSGTSDDLSAVAFAAPERGWAVGRRYQRFQSYYGAILATTDGGTTWIPQDSNVQQALNDVAFADADHGWAVGANGTIVATVDGGAHWNIQASGTGDTLTSVAFADAAHGWVIAQHLDSTTRAQSAVILSTANGGATWSPCYSGGTVYLNDIAFVDASRGWAVGNGGTMLATADGGLTWQAQYIPTSSDLLRVVSADANHGWAASRDNVFATTNGGGAWMAQGTVMGSLGALAFADAAHGVAVGAVGAIATTANGGTTWLARGSGPTGVLNDVDFADASHGWAAGTTGTILATDSGGTVWSRQSSGTTTTLRAVDFIDARHGWVVGDAGTVITTSDGGSTWRPQSTGAAYDLIALTFADDLHGWAAGINGTMPDPASYDGVILSTANGGASWSVQSVGAGNCMAAFSFVDATHGWAVGTHYDVTPQGSGAESIMMTGVILATTDGGQSWALQATGLSGQLGGVAFVDAQHGWASGPLGLIYATTDGGAHWTRQHESSTADLPSFNYANSIAFADALHGWAIGDRFVYATVNGGLTWREQPTGSTIGLHGLTCTDAQHAWIVGWSGTILASTSGGFAANADMTAPVTTPSVPSGHWYNRTMNVQLTALDSGGSGMTGGVAKTESKLDSQAWTTLSNVPVVNFSGHADDGLHTILYRSTDAAGNVEELKSLTIGMDTRLPSASAKKSVTCKKGRVAKLSYQVRDATPSSGLAKVTITIKAKKKIVKTITIKNAAANKALVYSFKVKLRRGAYTWTVRGTDGAGNPSKTSAARRLTVK